jgi:ABC-type phosphate transport system substrate-binding protein
MRVSMLRAVLGAGIAAGLVVTMSGVASAAPDDTRVSRTVVGIGSDTTYEVMNALDQVYNQSAGCAVIPASGGTFTTYKQTCIIGGSLAYDGPLIETENEYHDRIVEAYPVGSGNGATALFQFVHGGSGVALPADFSRSSSKRTLTAETGETQYESAYARDGISYWVGKSNNNVTQNGAGTLPTPNIKSADLKAVFLGDGNPNSSNTGCAINWAKQANGTKLGQVDSVGNATGTPGSGNIVVYATQTGSGTGKDFANFLQAGKVAADLQNCINPNFTDGTGEQHVIFENNATPICGDSHGSDAIFPYSFARFTQNLGSKGTCAGVLGAIDQKKPTLASIGKLATNGGFPFGRYVYNYFYVPNSVDPTDPSTWGNDPQTRSLLDYLDAKNGWLCTSNHSNDPFPGANSGTNYRAIIESTLKANGFAPLSLDTTGTPYGVGQSYCRTNAVT